jgi:hypothetical protein
MRYGRNEKVFAFMEDVTADCDRKHARSDSDPCAAICLRERIPPLQG